MGFSGSKKAPDSPSWSPLVLVIVRGPSEDSSPSTAQGRILGQMLVCRGSAARHREGLALVGRDWRQAFLLFLFEVFEPYSDSWNTSPEGSPMGLTFQQLVPGCPK